MESTKTYTSRSSARRAGAAAGLAAEQIEITVHKEEGDKVHFGWKAKDAPVEKPDPVVTTPAKPAKQAAASRAERPKQNGVKRPAPGGACAAVWQAGDAFLAEHGRSPTAKEMRDMAAEQEWNVNNAMCELYAWRKFSGITGRVTATA